MIDLVRPVVEVAQSEPGTTTYYVGTPAEDADETDLIFFEVYASKEAFDTHMAGTALQKLVAESASLFGGTPLVAYTIPLANSFVRTGTAPSLLDDGFTAVVRMTYAEGTDTDEVQNKLSSLIEYCKTNESQTLSYYICVDKTDPKSIYVFEQFESFKFCAESHVKTDAHAKATTFQADGRKIDTVFTKRLLGFSSK